MAKRYKKTFNKRYTYYKTLDCTNLLANTGQILPEIHSLHQKFITIFSDCSAAQPTKHSHSFWPRQEYNWLGSPSTVIIMVVVKSRDELMTAMRRTMMADCNGLPWQELLQFGAPQDDRMEDRTEDRHRLQSPRHSASSPAALEFIAPFLGHIILGIKRKHYAVMIHKKEK